MQTTKNNYVLYSDDNSEIEDFVISGGGYQLDDNAITFASFESPRDEKSILNLLDDHPLPKMQKFRENRSVLQLDDHSGQDNFFLPSGILLEESNEDDLSDYGTTSDYSKASDSESDVNSTWHALPSINNFQAWSSTDTHFSSLSKYFSSDSESDSFVFERNGYERQPGQSWENFKSKIEDDISTFQIVDETDGFTLRKFLNAMENTNQSGAVPNHPKFQFSRANYLPAHPRSPRWQYTKSQPSNAINKDNDNRRDKTASQKNPVSSKFVKSERKPKGTWKIKSPKTSVPTMVEIAEQSPVHSEQNGLQFSSNDNSEKASAAFPETPPVNSSKHVEDDPKQETIQPEAIQHGSDEEVVCVQQPQNPVATAQLEGNQESMRIQEIQTFGDKEPESIQEKLLESVQNTPPALLDRTETTVVKQNPTLVMPAKKLPKTKTRQYVKATPTKSKRCVSKTNAVFHPNPEQTEKPKSTLEHKPLLPPIMMSEDNLQHVPKKLEVPVRNAVVYLLLFTAFYVMIVHTLKMSGFGTYFPWFASVLLYLILVATNLYHWTIQFHPL